MNIFIDAYNLLKQLHAVTHVSEAQRHAFIEQLRRFARSKGHHMYLVFDGGQSSWSESEHMGPITIIHSGFKLSADDVIKQKITQYAHEHTILVSDDRQLCDYVAMAGFATLGTSNFYKLMKNEIHKGQAAFIKQGFAHKNPDHQSSSDLDALMQEASTIGYYKEQEILPEVRKSNQLSRKEKKLKKLVKKL